MVTTRSGLRLRRHDVRFKRGATVRRILDYDDSHYDFEINNEPIATSFQEKSESSPLRSILTVSNRAQPKSHSAQSNSAHLNGHSSPGPNTQIQPLSTNHINSVISADDKGSTRTDHSHNGESSILYDVSERDETRHSLLWDTLLFICITAVGVYSANYAYGLLGYHFFTILISLFITLFTYNIAYFDSDQPGVMPPSPISPAQYRRMSGHSYHLTYVMCIVNAVVFLVAEHLMQSLSVPAL